MTHVAETCLRTTGAEWTLSVLGGSTTSSPSSQPGEWPPETLLVAAAEASVFTEFKKRTKVPRLEVVFYESTALGRWGEGPEGVILLDLIVRPRVGVRSAPDAERARELFGLVQRSCAVGRELPSAFAVDPVIEVWPANSLCLIAVHSSAGH
ncbi:MAG: hypothetical protein ACLPJH_18315 [Myxococcaceae bacterium]